MKRNKQFSCNIYVHRYFYVCHCLEKKENKRHATTTKTQCLRTKKRKLVCL